MPLWQQQLANQQNSPTPSLRSRLKILDDSNSSSSITESLSEGNKQYGDLQRSTSHKYKSVQEQNPIFDAETCFIGNSLSSIDKIKNINLSREELYEESMPENFEAQKLITCENNETPSKNNSSREILGYLNHGADFTRNEKNELHRDCQHTPLKRLSSSSLPENFNISPIQRKSFTKFRNTFSVGVKRRQFYDVNTYCNNYRRQSYDVIDHNNNNKNNNINNNNTLMESEFVNGALRSLNSTTGQITNNDSTEGAVCRSLSYYRKHSNNTTASLISIVENSSDQDRVEYEKQSAVIDLGKNYIETDIDRICRSIDLEASKSFSGYESYERPLEEYREPSHVGTFNGCYYDDKEEDIPNVPGNSCDEECNTKKTSMQSQSSFYTIANLNKINRDVNTLRNEIVDLKCGMSELMELVRNSLSRSNDVASGGIEAPATVNR